MENFSFQAIEIKPQAVLIKEKGKLGRDLDRLAENIILAEDEKTVRWGFSLIWEISRQLGIIPASIYSLYKAKTKGQLESFTVPSINLRTLTYESAQALFAVAAEQEAGAFLLGIARSEIKYTQQSPFEYAALVLAAAAKANYKGPVFLQADSLRIDAEAYLKDPQKEISNLKSLIREYVEAGFFNIDLDMSSLEDLEDGSSDLHLKIVSQLASFIEQIQPPKIKIALGARIKKREDKNTSEEELHNFMEKHKKHLPQKEGVIKLAIETGAVHGGIVMPDGSVAKVRIDFDTIKKLSDICRRDYNLAGVVQHGASTLPPEAFSKFPEHDTLEVHLATQFQNIIYDNLPLSLKEKIYHWLNENFHFEKKPHYTNSQFIYKTRKKALGPFKKEIYLLPHDVKSNIFNKLKEEFSFLFRQLNLPETKSVVENLISPVAIKKNHLIEEEK